MRIAYYTSNRVIFPPRPGDLAASSVITADIVRHLKNNHDITVYAPKGSRMDGVNIIGLDFENFKIDSSVNSLDWMTKSVIGMKQIFLGRILEDAKSYDIIHLQTEPVYLGMPFVSLISTPVLFTPHHPFYESDRPIYEYYDGKITMSAISKYQASKFPMRQNLPVVHNGISIEKYRFNAISEGYFLYLGRFTEDKGIKEFIRLAETMPDNKFAVAGAGALEETVKASADKLENLEFLGYLDREQTEWCRVLSSAKALIMPTVGEESFGMVMIEAMAFGTPIIAYNKCAAQEIIEDNVTGKLVTNLNTDGLKSAIVQLNSLEPEEYRKLRQEARKKVESSFTSKIMADNYEKLYSQILKAG